jgi:uncharacterized membrane protein
VGSVESSEESERLKQEIERVEGLDGTGSDMSRIIGMSDAVFAFSMTFLVITLVLPGQAAASHADLAGYLGSIWPAMVAYVISFFIIAAWWGTHRRLFSPIIRYDQVLVRLNNIFLLVIAVTPFLVGILFYYGPGAILGPASLSAQLAVALYACVQVAGGLLLLGVWRYATRGHRLVEPRLSAEWIRRTEGYQLTTVAVFAASIPVAFLLPFVSVLMWIFVATSYRMVLSHRRKQRGPHRPSASSSPDRSSSGRA